LLLAGYFLGLLFENAGGYRTILLNAGELVPGLIAPYTSNWMYEYLSKLRKRSTNKARTIMKLPV
jgi:hypothetical protein